MERMVKGGPIPLLSAFKSIIIMHKSIEVELDYLFLYDYDEPEFHKVVDLDPRISKQISLNYAACSSLIEVSEEPTEYLCKSIQGRIKMCLHSGRQEVIWIRPNEVRIYTWNYPYPQEGTFITAESYERIYKLCNDLIDEVNDKFRKR